MWILILLIHDFVKFNINFQSSVNAVFIDKFSNYYLINVNLQLC